jgi:hypothetical protein
MPVAHRAREAAVPEWRPGEVSKGSRTKGGLRLAESRHRESDEESEALSRPLPVPNFRCLSLARRARSRVSRPSTPSPTGVACTRELDASLLRASALEQGAMRWVFGLCSSAPLLETPASGHCNPRSGRSSATAAALTSTLDGGSGEAGRQRPGERPSAQVPLAGSAASRWPALFALCMHRSVPALIRCSSPRRRPARQRRQRILGLCLLCAEGRPLAARKGGDGDDSYEVERSWPELLARAQLDCIVVVVVVVVVDARAQPSVEEPTRSRAARGRHMYAPSCLASAGTVARRFARLGYRLKARGDRRRDQRRASGEGVSEGRPSGADRG